MSVGGLDQPNLLTYLVRRSFLTTKELNSEKAGTAEFTMTLLTILTIEIYDTVNNKKSNYLRWLMDKYLRGIFPVHLPSSHTPVQKTTSEKRFPKKVNPFFVEFSAST